MRSYDALYKSPLPLKYTNPLCAFLTYIHHITFIKVNINRENNLSLFLTILNKPGNLFAVWLIDNYPFQRIHQPQESILIYLCCCGKAKRTPLFLKPFKCHDKIPLFIIYMNSTTAKRRYKINPVL